MAGPPSLLRMQATKPSGGPLPLLLLQQGDAALLAAASGLAQWHSKEKFHPISGAETVASAGMLCVQKELMSSALLGKLGTETVAITAVLCEHKRWIRALERPLTCALFEISRWALSYLANSRPHVLCDTRRHVLPAIS